jgi:hypothetical protein
VYPVILFGLFGPQRLFWLRWALLVAATGFALYAHGAIETPECKCDVGPGQQRGSRRTGCPQFARHAFRVTRSDPVVISMTLNLLALASTVSMLADGVKARGTVFRIPKADVRLQSKGR